jgi:hypothetical protein
VNNRLRVKNEIKKALKEDDKVLITFGEWYEEK